MEFKNLLAEFGFVPWMPDTIVSKTNYSFFIRASYTWWAIHHLVYSTPLPFTCETNRANSVVVRIRASEVSHWYSLVTRILVERYANLFIVAGTRGLPMVGENDFLDDWLSLLCSLNQYLIVLIDGIQVCLYLISSFPIIILLFLIQWTILPIPSQRQQSGQLIVMAAKWKLWMIFWRR